LSFKTARLAEQQRLPASLTLHPDIVVRAIYAVSEIFGKKIKPFSKR
jgi:hypothetical protein